MTRLTPGELKKSEKDRTITPEKIRRTGLRMLSAHPEGMRLAELFKETELELGFDYVIPEHSIKNALWNIVENYPEYVEKKKLSYRNVLLYPKKELIDLMISAYGTREDINKVNEVKEAVASYNVASQGIRQTLLTMKVMDIYRYIEQSELEDLLLEIQENDFKLLTVQEIEAIVGIKNSVAQLKNYRNQLAHGQSLRGTLF